MKETSYNRSLRVLIADDDADDRELLSEAIESLNVDTEVQHVEDGDRLMRYLAACSPNAPDLIFLDLNMPRKNGLECLIEIRTGGKFKETAIAIYSTSDSEHDIESTFGAGANIFITKPNSYKELQKILKDIFQIDWDIHNSGLNKENFVMKRESPAMSLQL